jgi:hypothetical protein
MKFGSKGPAPDLGTPSDLGGAASAPPFDPDSDQDQDQDASGGGITLTLTHEQATALSGLLDQLQSQLGDTDDDSADMGADAPAMASAGPMRGRGGYGS